MTFLVDECLAPLVAEVLRHGGHEAEHVTEQGLAGAPDSGIMERAAAQGRVVVSADTDFGELLARSNRSGPSVVLFRGEQIAARILGELLIANIDQVEAALTEGAVVVILDDRIRVRYLPIGAEPPRRE